MKIDIEGISDYVNLKIGENAMTYHGLFGLTKKRANALIDLLTKQIEKIDEDSIEPGQYLMGTLKCIQDYSLRDLEAMYIIFSCAFSIGYENGEESIKRNIVGSVVSLMESIGIKLEIDEDL